MFTNFVESVWRGIGYPSVCHSGGRVLPSDTEGSALRNAVFINKVRITLQHDAEGSFVFSIINMHDFGHDGHVYDAPDASFGFV